MNTRELALDVFLEAEKTGAYASSLIRDVLDKYDYEKPQEKAFFKRLAEGTLEQRIALDWAIDCYSKTPVPKMKPFVRNLLRLSAYQILYMEAVPDAAACNEAVKLAKKRGFASLSGFTNGVLRTLSRNKETLPLPDAQKDPVRALSVKYSLPEWMILLWTAQYGAQKTERMLENMRGQRPVTLRFRETLSEKELAEALTAIRRTNAKLEQHPLYPRAFVLSGFDGINSLPGFAEGLFYVQDVSSMLAVQCAGIVPGMQVMDLCAAPGGKAVLAAEKLAGVCPAAKKRTGGRRLAAGTTGETGTDGGLKAGGVLKAGDVSEAKADLIRENAARMGCDNLEISVWDAAQNMPEYNGWADVVLADVPCSGLGVMGRKKDIRYRVQREDLDTLVTLQKEIIGASWKYVKKGGILLYSTCTIDKMENEEMVRWITETFPFVAESLDGYLPECLHSEQTKDGMLQLFTGERNTDGFFMARLRRIG